jgi:hypothetical protein
VTQLAREFPTRVSAKAGAQLHHRIPQDIRLVTADHLQALGPIDLVVAGWPCQGSTTLRDRLSKSAVQFARGPGDAGLSIQRCHVKRTEFCQPIREGWYTVHVGSGRTGGPNSLQPEGTLMGNSRAVTILLDSNYIDCRAVHPTARRSWT